ncbi:Alcohol dehydrogenase, class IV [Pseudonocardia ammonioxydans]|uniref:Alcohol dehydrogenase, class IV n=1 Tax=Pseudonocardia ammonioxydans TaxID=260086 RepID=A0A1I4SDL1_PSUAM|nr:Alcohol dehydrogenase, class IV [Pseudonocardia ammonioxydans]
MVRTESSGAVHRDTVLVLDAGAARPGNESTDSTGYTVRSPECPREQRPRLSKFHAPEIVFGPDSLPETAHAALRLGAERPFVVTDPGVTEAGWPAELLQHLRAGGLRPQLWNEITPNPKDHEIQAGFERYENSGCDVVIGVGGGSVIDAAKGVALLAANGGAIGDYEGIDRISNPIPPLVMVPSTSGTGADVSQFCIITDTARLTKITIMGRALVPDVSVIDPRLLVTMPDWLNAATGLDALTHGIEAYVSLAHGPLTDTHALHAVALVHTNLPTTMIRRTDDGPRAAMAQAALEAGLAFTNAILGATHAMSHQVGGMLDLPHGLINGVLLPHVIRFNGADDPTRFVPIAQAMGLAARAGMPGDEAVDMVATEVRKLADEVGVPTGLGALGVRDADVPRLARLTLGDACLTTNPRTAGVEQIENLFRAAL